MKAEANNLLKIEELERQVAELEESCHFKDLYIKKLDGIIEEVGGVSASCIDPYEDIKNALQGQKDLAQRYFTEIHTLREAQRPLQKKVSELEMNGLLAFLEIRKAIGDPEGRLSQPEVVKKVKEMAEENKKFKEVDERLCTEAEYVAHEQRVGLRRIISEKETELVEAHAKIWALKEKAQSMEEALLPLVEQAEHHQLEGIFWDNARKALGKEAS